MLTIIFGKIVFVAVLMSWRCAATDVCKTAKKQYSVANTYFTQCAIENAEPVTYCTQCIESYLNFAGAYNNLMTAITDKDGKNITCRSIYVDNDRLNLIENIHKNTRNLWNAGYCTDCFNPECDPDKGPAQNCTISNSTQEFEAAHADTTKCISLSQSDRSTNPCINCVSKYNDLNRIYNKIRAQKGDKFCFDVKDKMNKTRILWSKDLRCCDDRNSSTLAFYILALTLMAIGLVFYLTNFVYGLHAERLAFIPNDLMPVDVSTANVRSNTDIDDAAAMNINASTSSLLPAPAAMPSHSGVKFAKLVNIENDSDEENEDAMLPIFNPQLVEIS